MMAVAGCGDDSAKVYSVDGTVTYQGKSVTNAFVTFVPDDGRPARVEVDAAGNYRLEVVQGRSRVEVKTFAPPVSTEGSDLPPDRGGNVPQVTAAIPIPDKYTQYDSSGLEYNVVPSDSNHYDIVLE